MTTTQVVKNFGYQYTLAEAGIPPGTVKQGGKGVASKASYLGNLGSLLQSSGGTALLVGLGMPLALGAGGALVSHELGPDEKTKEEYGEELLARQYRLEIQRAMQQERDRKLYEALKKQKQQAQSQV